MARAVFSGSVDRCTTIHAKTGGSNRLPVRGCVQALCSQWFRGWDLRGQDLNLRPLGYETDPSQQPEAAGHDQVHFYWVIGGRGATPAHPKPRQIVPVLSPRRRHFSIRLSPTPFNTERAPLWQAKAAGELCLEVDHG